MVLSESANAKKSSSYRKKFIDYVLEDGEGAVADVPVGVNGAPAGDIGGQGADAIAGIASGDSGASVSAGIGSIIDDDGEEIHGTTSDDIAPWTYPLGTIIRRRKDASIFTLKDNNNEVSIPEGLERRIRKIINKGIILEQNVTTDNIEFALSESLGDVWNFDGFKCYKSILQFRSGNRCFKIFQNNIKQYGL